ncbi:hypothetical protein ACFXJ5_10700 [Streptomyces sp. NPDC059373]
MAKEQFGVQLEHLHQLQKDWDSASKRVEEMSKKLGETKAAITRAAGTDLTAAAAVMGPALLAGLATAYQVLQDVREIEAEAYALSDVHDKLTTELAADAQKLKTVAEQYAETDRKNQDELKKHDKHRSAPTSPGHSGGGGSSRSGGGSKTPTTSDSFDSQGDGKWKTVGSWDAWSPDKHHTTRGAGVIDAPDTSGLSDDRKDVVNRALERINHRIGYSQSATTNGYRDDCSGFVSAAWGLDPPGANTDGLMGSQYSHQIGKNDLQPGDALIAGDHTVLFGGWADDAHTKYIALEDNGSQGTVSHVIPYPYYSGDAAHERSIGQPYLPYRRNGL